jgi:hypothetical protein
MKWSAPFRARVQTDWFTINSVGGTKKKTTFDHDVVHGGFVGALKPAARDT